MSTTSATLATTHAITAYEFIDDGSCCCICAMLSSGSVTVALALGVDASPRTNVRRSCAMTPSANVIAMAAAHVQRTGRPASDKTHSAARAATTSSAPTTMQYNIQAIMVSL